MRTAADLRLLRGAANNIKNRARAYGRDYTLPARLTREIIRAEGREDRANGKGMLSANGTYLEGYHDTDDSPYHITWDELIKLRDEARK